MAGADGGCGTWCGSGLVGGGGTRVGGRGTLHHPTPPQ